jgi:4-amino-4-deoxy-L-arabinose transferase-like glycosyltransferase
MRASLSIVSSMIRKSPGLYLLLLFFLLVGWFVNPAWQTMFGDDWAYALTVRHLLANGTYQLHDWATANMPAQVYWTAFLAHLFGYSFVVLRCSTLIVCLIGLIAFYHLLRDFGVRDIEASLLSLTLLSSPLVLFLSFTFQTDVQFLGWNILALWLYTRALRQQSYLLMTLASLAAFAAIGTRQFGAALIAGLVGTWLLFEQDRLRKVPLYLVGLVLPLMMTVWQISSAFNRPTFYQNVQLAKQTAYVRNWPNLMAELLWRPTAILQYMGLFLLPLVGVLAVLIIDIFSRRVKADGREVTLGQPAARAGPWVLCACAIYITAGVAYEYFFHQHQCLVPFLDWLLVHRAVLEPLLPVGLGKRFVLTILMYSFAVVLGWLWSQALLQKRNWRRVRPESWFLLFAAVALLAVHLIYVQFYDVYLIQFLPFALLAVGYMLKTWPRYCQAVVAALCLLVLLVSSLWIRGNLAEAQANWHAAELARSAGAAPQDIAATLTWNCYNGAFDEWIASVGGLDAARRYSKANSMYAFFEFLKERYRRAEYIVTPPPLSPDPNWRLLGKVEYRDKWLRRQYIYARVRSTKANLAEPVPLIYASNQVHDIKALFQ